MKRIVLTTVAAVFLASCAQMAHTPPAPKLKDGEVRVPSDYRSWPTTIKDIQRPDAKQVRDIYVNTAGAGAKAGQPLPDGSVIVMDLYKANLNPDGTVIKGADGKLVKGDLLKVFVMAKGAGWGELAPTGLKNGDWSYAAYMPDAKTASADQMTACRTCHLPIGEAKDFVARYNDYVKK